MSECDGNDFFFMIAGLFVGALIRYAASKTTTTHLEVYPNVSATTYNQSLPPDTLWLKVIQHFILDIFSRKHFFSLLSPSDSNERNITYWLLNVHIVTMPHMLSVK